MDSRTIRESDNSYSETDKLQMKFNEITESLKRLYDEKDRLYKIHCEEKNNWSDSLKNIQEVLADAKKSNSSLKAKKDHLDSYIKALPERQAFISSCYRFLYLEKRKIESSKRNLEGLSEEQQRAKKSRSRLLEELQREGASEKPQEQGVLSTKERLNIELEKLKEKLELKNYHESKRGQQSLEGTSSSGNAPA